LDPNHVSINLILQIHQIIAIEQPGFYHFDPFWGCIEILVGGFNPSEKY
jgi:hypothetical protein